VPPHYDAVIVGGGHNGLVTSAYLAAGGLSTLVLERREIVGGACVTEEIHPGCRASTTSYIASMLRPEIVRDLDLPRHGLRMVQCRPSLQIASGDGVLAWWPEVERTQEEISRHSRRDAQSFPRMLEELDELARILQPFFLRPPPDPRSTGLSGARQLASTLWQLRGVRGRDVERLVEFLTGSLSDYLDRRFESDVVKSLVLANSVYGRHGGPSQPGTVFALLFHLLTGGEHEEQGYFGHVIGGMGSITQAIAAAAEERGVEIRTATPVARIDVHDGRTRGVTLEDGTEVRAPMVLSNADPRTTFLSLVDKQHLPDDFLQAVRGLKMDGPCAKVNFVLSEEPQVRGMPHDADGNRRSLFTLVPTLEAADRCYDESKRGTLPKGDQLWVDCVVASNVDASLAPEGLHVMHCFIQFVPYRLAEGTWDERREELGDAVVERIARHAPNVASSVVARQVLTPLDLEREYGLTEGNINHGDLGLDQLLFRRPVPGWSQYATPVGGLYLCGSGAHPGGGVTGAPGYNAARRALRDRRRGRRR
jgi:phytoene dehydrogenase-like protein